MVFCCKLVSRANMSPLLKLSSFLLQTHIRPRHQLATEHHDPVKLLRATPYNKKPKRWKTTAQLADRSQASIVANQICRLKRMLLNKITSDITRSKRGLELCGLASLQNKERQFCVFLPQKGFPACNVFVQTDSQQAAADHRAAFLFLLVSESHH